jgi:hypothetical protein
MQLLLLLLQIPKQRHQPPQGRVAESAPRSATCCHRNASSEEEENTLILFRHCAMAAGHVNKPPVPLLRLPAASCPEALPRIVI